VSESIILPEDETSEQAAQKQYAAAMIRGRD